jgi:amino acid adenylation domain-containing protein
LVASTFNMEDVTKSAVAHLISPQDPASGPGRGRTKRKLLLDVIEAQAQLNPCQPAVVAPARQLTYRELDEYANRIAAALAVRGVTRECVVALALERSVHLIAAMIGVWKTGAAFTPLEPSWPDVRLNSFIRASQSRYVIASSGTRKRVEARGTDVLTLDEHSAGLPRIAFKRSRCVDENNLAYVLFTSGSTGEPKPVGVEHRNISNYVNSILSVLQAPPGSTFAWITSAAADLGYTMLFPSLCAGGVLQVISVEAARSPELLEAWFREHPPDYMKITPSYAAALLESDSARNLLPRKGLVLGGEILRCTLIERIRELSPHLAIANHYGPTETAVGVLVNKLKPNLMPQCSSVPLGKPLREVQIRVLDSNMHDLSATSDGIGELYIGGECVSRGYLGRPDLTASRFVPDPTGSSIGGRLYRTSDLVRISPEGEIEFLSRTDQQFKIRGYRVEPGEIEVALCTHPDVRKAVVLPERHGDEVSLIACLEMHQLWEPEPLREWLKARLPEHMVPARVVCMDQMPLLASGKIDRQAVAAAARSQPIDKILSATVGATEERVAKIWRKVLKTDAVGATQNFFEIGGNSLRMIQLQTEFKREFGNTIPVGVLFGHPTIRGLAAHLSARGSAPSGEAGAEVAENRRAALNVLRDRGAIAERRF